MAIIKSVQNIVIVIAANSLSNTATITSIDATKSVAEVNGGYGGGSSTISQNVAGAQVINGTTITVTRAVTDASISLTVSVCVTEYVAAAIQSVQQGTVVLSAATSGTATITSVTTGNSVPIWGGWTVTSGLTSWGGYPQVVLTNATTVTVTTGQTVAGLTLTFYYTILQLASGILNSSTQTGTITLAAGVSTSSTATISSVGTSQTQLVYNGWTYPNAVTQSIYQFFSTLQLTNGTTITGSNNYTPSKPSAITIPFSVLEYKLADIKSFQSGSTVMGVSGTTGTTTVTTVNTGFTMLNWDGYYASTTGTFQNSNTDIELTNPTTLTVTRTTSSTLTTTTFWQLIEFIQGVFHDAWSDPDDVYQYRRKNINFLLQSVFDCPHIPAFFGKYFQDAWAVPDHIYPYKKPDNGWINKISVLLTEPGRVGIVYSGAWAEQDDVFFYKQKNYWWITLPEKYEANPAQIKIFFQDAWSDPDDVFFYPRRNYPWITHPEKYESNPANIGIFYTGAWVDMPDVKYFPAKNMTRQMVQSVMQPELATIGLIFSAAFTTQICSPARAPLNLEFLNIAPVILTGYGQAIDDYIIRARRRHRR